MTNFEKYLKQVGEVGNVIGSTGTIVTCSGLLGAKIWEKVVFENESLGIVHSISRKNCEILLLSFVNVTSGMMVVRTNETLSVEVSAEAIGRVIDVFGKPIDSKGNFKKLEDSPLEAEAVSIVDRARINQNLETGVTIVDLLIPLGKGQRELIIGDQKSGKTSFLTQVIARQTQLGTICIYCAIGKKKSDLAASVEKLERLGALAKTVVVAAPSSTPSSIIYLAPLAAMAYAEYFMSKGHDVLVVLDEISSHAKYYRELSILSKRMPGRDGYPGDIFYLHSHLLERAGRFIRGDGEEETITLKIGGKTVSISCLPVVETLGSDFTGYIQTNLMSMTDGHLFFDISKFQEGLRPAVNVGLSVSRVGKQTQNTIERQLAIKSRELLLAYSKGLSVAKFGIELLAATRDDIAQGERINAIFHQTATEIVPRTLQLLFLQLLFCVAHFF